MTDEFGLDQSESTENPEQDDDTGCTRCDAPLIFLGEPNLHEGGSGFGFLFGSMRELFEERMRLEMWACQDCGHVEFFMPLKKNKKK
jgi:hypothetical protein